MKKLLILNGVFAVISTLTLIGGFGDTRAMPMFSRKLGVPCSTCHITPPRLNETGYRFRAAGFRMPEMIGQTDDEPFKLWDYISARLQVRHETSRSKIGSEMSTRHQTVLHAFELYPFTGAWGKYLSSNFKLTFAPEKSPAVEAANIKVNRGDEKRFFGFRAGIFHPFDGFGASDSPAAISRPFFLTNAANLDQTTFFTTWGFDQLGAEVGFDYRQTSVRATLLNGLVLAKKNGNLTAFAAQGGPLTRSSPLRRAHNTPDFQLLINHVLHPEGGGLSLYYYRGNLTLPTANDNGSFHNAFDRAALYGSYPVAKYLHLLAGFQRGRDRTRTGGTFSSEGAFAEAAVPIHELSEAGVRYDWFDPARNKPNNETEGVTVFVNAWFYQQVRIVAEYQHKSTERGSAPEREDDTFQVRFIFIK